MFPERQPTVQTGPALSETVEEEWVVEGEEAWSLLAAEAADSPGYPEFSKSF